MYVGVPKRTLTCWPSFSISRTNSGYQAEIKDISTLALAASTKIRDGACCDSQIGWRPHICKVLPGCIMKDSEISIGVNISVLVWGLGLGSDEDWA